MRPTDYIAVRVTGAAACFTRPECKVERVSYDVMTPSAARNILQAVYWKPGFNWNVDKIVVQAPIRWMSNIMRNEVKGPTLEPTQRNNIYLRDVDYVIVAHVVLSGEETRHGQLEYLRTAQRHLEVGSRFSPPFFGLRELSVDECHEVALDDLHPIAETRDLGRMFFDRHYPSGVNMFFDAKLEHGVVHCPSYADMVSTEVPHGAH